MKQLPIKIKISERFFNSEYKCDYFITEKSKRIWAVELDLLIQFDKICKEHSIKYSLFAGTMLGAIRHKGFIPWDDDIDVCMDRKNFKKLLSIQECEIEYPYFLQTPYNDTRYFCPYIRFRNSDTTGIILGQESSEYNNGIYIDVFVLDGKPQNKLLQWFHYLLLRIVRNIIICYNINIIQAHGFYKIRLLLYRIISKKIKNVYWINLYEKILGMFNNFSNQLALLTHGYNNFTKYWLTHEEINEIQIVDFEGYKLPIVKNYDTVLKRIYNDYMKYPPINERGTWHKGKIEFDPDISYKEYFNNIEQTKI